MNPLTPSFDPYTHPIPPGITALTAGAGTGKTHAIVQLYLRLLLEHGLTPHQILVVTFTRAAAAELRQRLHTALLTLYLSLTQDPSSPPPLPYPDLPPLLELRARLQRALADRDQTLITTIDAFLLEIARRHALALGISPTLTLISDQALQPLHHTLIARAHHVFAQEIARLDPNLLALLPNPKELVQTLLAYGLDLTFPPSLCTLTPFLDRYRRNPYHTPSARRFLGEKLEKLLESYRALLHQRRLPAFFHRHIEPLKAGLYPDDSSAPPSQALSALLRRDTPPRWHQDLAAAVDLPSLDAIGRSSLQSSLIHHQRAIVHTSWQEALQAYLAERGETTLYHLRRALTTAISRDPLLARRLGNLYPAILIDEFQDTDPDQWQLFHTLHTAATTPHRWLFLVGDPKQAIYAFRGCNLETYFAAIETADHRHHLTRNHRSHPHLLDALNALFADPSPEAPHFPPNPFDDPRLSVPPLQPAVSQLPFPLLTDAEFPFPLLRLITYPDTLPSIPGVDPLHHILATDLITTLLTSTTLTATGRPPQLREIAILVPHHDAGNRLQRLLTRLGVPTLRIAPTTVWKSPIAASLVELLALLLNPTDSARLRRLLLGPLWAEPPQHLTDSQRLTDLQHKLHLAAQLWHQQGLYAALDYLFTADALWQKLRHRPDASRLLTDLRHLSELLQTAAHRHRFTPLQTYHWALHQLDSPARAEADEQRLRLETDRDAVTILTVHASKGLEYPIVLLLADWNPNPRSQPIGLTPTGRCYHPDPDPNNPPQREATREILRQFYVACTRARHHLTIYYPPTPSHHPILRLLTQRKASLLALNPPGSPPLVAHEERLPPAEPLPRWRPSSSPPSLSPSSSSLLRRALPLPHRERTSFTRLARALDDDASPLFPLLERSPENLPSLAPALSPLSLPSDPLPPGIAFGKLFHTLLQQLPPLSPLFPSFDPPHLLRFLQRHPLAAAFPPEMQEALAHLLYRTLHADLGGITLAHLPSTHQSREHPFLLIAPAFDAAKIDALLADLPGWRPIPPFPPTAHPRFEGIIDLIYRDPFGRYHLLDFKTNRLPAYTPRELIRAAQTHGYLFQIVLYTLALHRHLRATLPSYTPALHLGSSHLLFVRGLGNGDARLTYTLTDRIERIDAAFGSSVPPSAPAVLYGNSPLTPATER
ncbi:MAG: UvrD-helicase domain-containing protein [Hydrogenophilus sp.]|nr:UvrD-helicase domain-containing protein [Hydrogenophilus sp.]